MAPLPSSHSTAPTTKTQPEITNGCISDNEAQPDTTETDAQSDFCPLDLFDGSLVPPITTSFSTSSSASLCYHEQLSKMVAVAGPFVFPWSSDQYYDEKSTVDSKDHNVKKEDVEDDFCAVGAECSDIGTVNVNDHNRNDATPFFCVQHDDEDDEDTDLEDYDIEDCDTFNDDEELNKNDDEELNKKDDLIEKPEEGVDKFAANNKCTRCGGLMTNLGSPSLDDADVAEIALSLQEMDYKELHREFLQSLINEQKQYQVHDQDEGSNDELYHNPEMHLADHVRLYKLRDGSCSHAQDPFDDSVVHGIQPALAKLRQKTGYLSRNATAHPLRHNRDGSTQKSSSAFSTTISPSSSFSLLEPEINLGSIYQHLRPTNHHNDNADDVVIETRSVLRIRVGVFFGIQYGIVLRWETPKEYATRLRDVRPNTEKRPLITVVCLKKNIAQKRGVTGSSPVSASASTFLQRPEEVKVPSKDVGKQTTCSCNDIETSSNTCQDQNVDDDGASSMAHSTISSSVRNSARNDNLLCDAFLSCAQLPGLRRNVKIRKRKSKKKKHMNRPRSNRNIKEGNQGMSQIKENDDTYNDDNINNSSSHNFKPPFLVYRPKSFPPSSLCVTVSSLEFLPQISVAESTIPLNTKVDTVQQSSFTTVVNETDINAIRSMNHNKKGSNIVQRLTNKISSNIHNQKKFGTPKNPYLNFSLQKSSYRTSSGTLVSPLEGESKSPSSAQIWDFVSRNAYNNDSINCVRLELDELNDAFLKCEICDSITKSTPYVPVSPRSAQNLPLEDLDKMREHSISDTCVMNKKQPNSSQSLQRIGSKLFMIRQKSSRLRVAPNSNSHYPYESNPITSSAVEPLRSKKKKSKQRVLGVVYIPLSVAMATTSDKKGSNNDDAAPAVTKVTVPCKLKNKYCSQSQNNQSKRFNIVLSLSYCNPMQMWQEKERVARQQQLQNKRHQDKNKFNLSLEENVPTKVSTCSNGNECSDNDNACWSMLCDNKDRLGSRNTQSMSYDNFDHAGLRHQSEAGKKIEPLPYEDHETIEDMEELSYFDFCCNPIW